MNIEEKIRILIVEDLVNDAELIRYELKRYGFRFDDMVVCTESDYITGIKDFAPDLILSDYNLPSFNGMQALLIRQERAPQIPFILVTGSLNEEIAVQIIKSGADDYILKGNLIRLGPAIISAIEKQETIRLKMEAEETILRERILLRTVIDNLPDAIYVKDITGRKLIANKADLMNIGLDSEAEALGKTDIELFKTEIGKRGYADDLFVLTNNQSIFNKEEYFYDSQGNMKWLLTSKIPLCDENNKVVGLVGIGRDYTEKKKMEDALKEWEAIFTTFMNYSPILILFKDENARFIRVSKSFEQLMEKKTNEILGKTMVDIFPSKSSEQMVRDDLLVLNQGLPLKKVERFNGRILETTKFPIVRENQPNYLAGYSIDITDRKQAEKELKESHKRLSAILDNLFGVVYLCENDPEYTMNYISDGITELSGYPAQDFINNKVRSFNSIIHPEDRYLVWNEIQKAIGARQSYSFEYRIVTIEEKVKWVWERGKALFDDEQLIHLEGFIADITSRKLAEEELKKAKELAEINELLVRTQKKEIELNNERLESLLRISEFQTDSVQELLDFALDEVIRLTNSKIGYIYFYNENTQQFTLNTWSDEVMSECEVVDTQTVYDLDKTGFWGEAVRQRKPMILNDFKADNALKKGLPEGHAELKRFLTIPVFFRNKIVAVTGVANKETDYYDSDIRQMTLLMDNVWNIVERFTLIENLKSAKEKAEESDRLKTAFLHNISHEIRTPMNAIVGFSQFLNKPGLTPQKQHQFTDIICQSSNQLLSIINDIINSAAIEAGQETLRKDQFNVNSTLYDLYEQFLLKTEPKNIGFQCITPLEDKEVILINDETKLVQVISNLLNNAIKFTQKGEIQFGYRHKGRELEFFVKDTGIGISKEKYQKIFERFTQADETIAQFYGGTGLGLSISKGYVELMGGSIWVESEPGEGSEFCFTLPYQPLKIEIKTSDAFPAQFPQTNSKTILVAEDEETNYMLIEEVLAEMKVEVLRAENGQEAVDLCKSKPTINLVLMDLKMPVMDGFEATRQIKLFRPGLPVIAQSAYVHDEDKKRALDHGCDDYLTKPISFEQLIEVMKRYI